MKQPMEWLTSYIEYDVHAESSSSSLCPFPQMGPFNLDMFLGPLQKSQHCISFAAKICPFLFYYSSPGILSPTSQMFALWGRG